MCEEERSRRRESRIGGSGGGPLLNLPSGRGVCGEGGRG